MLHRCDNCEMVFGEDDLNEIKKFFERVTPGGIVPSGECPDSSCQALCYPMVPEAGGAARNPTMDLQVLHAKKLLYVRILTIPNDQMTERELCLMTLLAGDRQVQDLLREREDSYG